MNWSWSWLFPWLRPTPPPAPAPQPDPIAGDFATQLLSLHNEARAAHGLPLLRYSATLERAAAAHARKMAARGVLAHTLLGEPTLEQRVTDSGYSWSACAENIAEGYPDASSVMNFGWLHSPGHRANILGPYTGFGGAVAARLGGGLYWCTVFGELAA